MFNAKDIIGEFNLCKRDCSPMTTIQVRELLHRFGMPIDYYFFMEIKKTNLLTKIHRRWVFNTQPTHYGVLQSAYDRYRDRNKPLRDSIQNAIDLLKANGYKVFKEV